MLTSILPCYIVAVKWWWDVVAKTHHCPTSISTHAPWSLIQLFAQRNFHCLPCAIIKYISRVILSRMEKNLSPYLKVFPSHLLDLRIAEHWNHNLQIEMVMCVSWISTLYEITFLLREYGTFVLPRDHQ